MTARKILLSLAFLLLLAVTAWIAFQPWTANHFGYALPVSNGLPCRLHYRGRDYENDDQCSGMNRTAASNNLPQGRACQSASALRKTEDSPLQQVASVWTLLGSAHPVLVSRRENAASGFTTVVLYVSDSGCYRPYTLLGGP